MSTVSRIKRAALPFLVVAALLALSMPAAANVIAGGGYSSSYAGESAFTNVDVGGTGQFSAIFFNDGTQTWQPRVVGLLVCATDKVSCNVPSNASFSKGWYSQTVYATVTTTIAPGQNGFFIYNFTVPTGTPAGTVTTFYGDVGLIATGAVLRPEGYYQLNTVPTPPLSLTLSPSSATLPVGGMQQFTVTGQPAGMPITWTVTGGCGAVTTNGLFAATAMNSSTQPCTVIASTVGWRGVAQITVYGTVTQLACAVTPNQITADGGTSASGRAIATIAFKDQNGNVVANASAPQISVNNVTPTTAQMTPIGAVYPTAGAVTVTITSTTTPGDVQLSASAVGLLGCNVLLASVTSGTPTKTDASFSASPLAADGVSTTTLQIDVTDANGVRVTSDNLTQISIGIATGTNVCRIVSVAWGLNPNASLTSATAVAYQGRVAFIIQSTSVTGQCAFVATTNNSSIAGTSATLTTVGAGPAAKLVIVSNDSPHQASIAGACDLSSATSDPSCTRIVVGVQDANGVLVTGDNLRAITVSVSASLCAGAGGDVLQRGSTTTSGGKATFVFSSSGAYAACAITFSATGLVGVSATAIWTSGSPDHLACAFSPDSMPSNTYPTVRGTVTVRDALNNVVTTGTYSVMLNRTSGTATNSITASPQYTSGGIATFTLMRQGTNIGVDIYAPMLASGSLPGTVPNTSCTIVAN